ncbi:hypothetical protein FRX31_005250 [Thalictrum thalictroides]|uniref:Uncharacterized protein n=1 Tax=Thalictrum thalictroides TaxID=46969 RepID=A0A7J6X5Y5_THATH|nr:hypothetical protein FRX31_005250 [Thalictrum thalictroides]
MAIWIQKNKGQVDDRELDVMQEGTRNAAPKVKKFLTAMVEQNTCDEQQENCDGSTKETTH